MKFPNAIADLELSVRVIDSNLAAVGAHMHPGDADEMRAARDERAKAIEVLRGFQEGRLAWRVEP